MTEKGIRKIVYFDRETIRNILQEQNRGDYLKKTDFSSSAQNSGSVDVSTKVKLDVPFLLRLSFLFNGELQASYIVRKDSTTTISSTEISEFEKLKPLLVKMDRIQVRDIENSSTSLRVAGGYLKIVKGGVEGVDTKEFKTVMDSYDGYDTYSIDANRYVRFNNAAFVSNYKRNDLLATTMTIFCIPVGKFSKDRFDFIKEINKMERLISTADRGQTLADVYPPIETDVISHAEDKEDETAAKNKNIVELFDVIYACILAEGKDE